MIPHITKFGAGEGGVRRVVEAYNRYLPEFGIEFVNPDTFSYDLLAVHAGVSPGADIAHNHGIYWTADLELTDYEWSANVAVINSLREARQITVPSEWVAESIRRDMRINPHVIGHGIEWDEWQTTGDDGGYVLWNKNRDFDICNPEAIVKLARLFPSKLFLSTFAPNPSPNLRVVGQVPHEQMRQLILSCSVYLSSIKETFGIGTLEAMAAGKPILGWANGGNLDLVKHGVNGYLAQPGNYEDLANGLEYCLEHKKTLGDNGREMATAYTWREVCEQVANVYEMADEEPETVVTVGIVIPVYNKPPETVTRAVESCWKQTYPVKIIVVNDGSDKFDYSEIKSIFGGSNHVPIIDQTNQGVAAARNTGIRALKDREYIACLDADDWIEPTFIEKCVQKLEEDRTIGIAYTGLRWNNPQTGESKVSDWPGGYVAAKQFDYEARQNQIPTCCVFRRDAWDRVGGFRSRYCPDGAGSEDAAFWSQILSIGYTAKQVTPNPLFNYSLGGQVSADTDYHEIDWLAWLPFSRDKRYPFACSVLPQRFSHPVRQYDEPELSIVIPVGPGHEGDLRTALDSIEAQHFRDWETIAVLDTGNEYYPDLYKAYPHVKWGITDGKRGAGYARNQGAEMAKGKFLFFLDADDFLNPAEPHALGEMIAKFWETGNGIYSAHIGRAIVSSAYAEKMQRENRLAAWNEKLGQAYISNPGIDYNCEQAVAEPRDHPDGKFYIWNLISTLIPRQWHFDIGGFDENMKTWEDWDYWLRMAKAGRCFTRIPKPYIIYNYISGTRRELGLQKGNEVLQYLKTKHERVKIAMCGCGGSKKAGETMTEAEGYVMATYISRNVGRHDIGFGLGRHVGGGAETFLVPEQIAKSNPQLFKIAEEIVADPSPAPEQMAAPTPIYSVDGGFSWTEDELIDVSTLSPFLQQQLKEVDLISKEAIRAAGVEALKRLKGVGEATAKKIMELAE